MLRHAPPEVSRLTGCGRVDEVTYDDLGSRISLERLDEPEKR